MNDAADGTPAQDELRQHLRAERLRVPPAQRRRAAARIAAVLDQWPAFEAARTIAGYHAVGGEVSPRRVLERAMAEGKAVFLPVLDEREPRRLHFARWRPGAPMRENRFGIPEPVDAPRRAPDELDLVLAPLVACDRAGHRIGMGGGFYDTTFSYRLERPDAAPRLVGLAYEFQVVERIEPREWDVPMDYLLTPEGIIECRSAS